MTPTQKTAIEATLSNDEVSTNKELLDYFISDIGVTEYEAIAFISERNNYLKGIKYGNKNTII